MINKDDLEGKSFGYGAQSWPNVDSLICDAAGYKFQKERAAELEKILYCVLKIAGPIAISNIALHVKSGPVSSVWDMSNGTIILRAD